MKWIQIKSSQTKLEVYIPYNKKRASNNNRLKFQTNRSVWCDMHNTALFNIINIPIPTDWQIDKTKSKVITSLWSYRQLHRVKQTLIIDLDVLYPSLAAIQCVCFIISIDYERKSSDKFKVLLNDGFEMFIYVEFSSTMNS